MIYLTNDKTSFPSPDTASEEGIVALGGSLTPERLIEAYSEGIFPWYNEGEPVVWWSPDPSLCTLSGEIAYQQAYA